MGRKLLIGCAGLLGILLVAAIIAFFVADSRFGILRAPRTLYSDAAGLEWPIRIIVEPQHISENLVALTKNANSGLPPSLSNPRLLREVLPQEVAILLAPEVSTSTLEITAFTNENRFGPVLKDVLAQIPGTMPNVNWSTVGLQYPKRGTFLLNGTQAISPLAVDFYTRQWESAGYQQPLTTTGGHFIEILLDNRNGMALLLTAMGFAESDPRAIRAPSPDPTPEEKMAATQTNFITNSLKKIDALALFADPGDGDTLEIRLEVTCDPEAGRSGPETVKTVLDTGLGYLQEYMQASYGVTLQGKTQIEGTNLVGTYTAQPFSQLLTQLMM